MNFVKKNKTKIIILVCIFAVFAASFFAGGNNQSSVLDNSGESEPAEVLQPETEPENTPENTYESAQKENIEENKKGIAKEEEKTDVDEPYFAKDEDVADKNRELTCTLSVRCDNAVGKVSEKTVVIPNDGVIFKEQNVVFYEGESVFNVLVREMKKNKIHLEFVNTPIYNSAYIEGINNLYEFDCGELSGWMYKVNGCYPSYGCSRYEIKDGDKIEWVYTCDLGKDVGGEYSARNGMNNE
ncbi:MAG: DUF4430 domain-containing protein [Clostridia bacterium]|nr:DUF4430 domain-containing protein [Clostridia bacterium]MBQ9737738.1 DUF4430 domain-containing protein [Clostridia bacterium]